MPVCLSFLLFLVDRSLSPSLPPSPLSLTPLAHSLSITSIVKLFHSSLTRLTPRCRQTSLTMLTMFEHLLSVYYPGLKNWNNHAPVGTGACSLKHACSCSLACVAVSVFLARVEEARFSNCGSIRAATAPTKATGGVLFSFPRSAMFAGNKRQNY